MTYDVFISHASEDKMTVARPLADLLHACGYRVWLDSFELTVGDSLRERIDHGLSNSRFGVLILSHQFFQKDWPKRELNGLYAKATQSTKVLLPVWHGITREDVALHSPLLADCLAANTDQGLDAAADALDRAMSLNRSSFGRAQSDVSNEHAKETASHNVHANPKGVFFKFGLLNEVDCLLAGPSNAGLADHGHSAAISLVQTSAPLGLLHPTFDNIVVLRIMVLLEKEIGQAFGDAHQQLVHDSA